MKVAVGYPPPCHMEFAVIEIVANSYKGKNAKNREKEIIIIIISISFQLKTKNGISNIHLKAEFVCLMKARHQTSNLLSILI